MYTTNFTISKQKVRSKYDQNTIKSGLDQVSISSYIANDAAKNIMLTLPRAEIITK